MFFEPKLINHIQRGGNVGVSTGFGRLIVIDFDFAEYQKEKEGLMPNTFTTKSAGKGLKHFYYLLKGEMFAKIGVDNYWMDGKKLSPAEQDKLLKSTTGRHRQELIDEGGLVVERVADIQAGRCGLTIPPSKINGKYYSVVRDEEIVEITVSQLSTIFDLKYFRKARQRRTNFSDEEQPIKIQEAIDLFKKLGVPRASERHFRCPLHTMKGNGNLWVGNDGSIHCFHCGFHKDSAADFLRWWEERDGVKIQI